MKFLISYSFFWFSMMAFGNDNEYARYYYCHGDDVELSFYQLFPNNHNFLALEMAGAAVEIDDMATIDHEASLDAVAKFGQQHEMTLRLKKPNQLEEEYFHQAGSSGQLDIINYESLFETSLVIKRKSSKHEFLVQCEIFALGADAIDNMASCIP